MGFVQTVLSCLALLLSPLTPEAVASAPTASVAFVQLDRSSGFGDLLVCPFDLPSPSDPLLNDFVETAIDEEDSDSEEDSTHFGCSAAFPHMPFGGCRFLTELGKLPSPEAVPSQRPVSSPILRC
jgi:hypothetical protein